MQRQDFASVEEYDDYLIMIEDTIDMLIHGDENQINNAKRQMKREYNNNRFYIDQRNQKLKEWSEKLKKVADFHQYSKFNSVNYFRGA